MSKEKIAGPYGQKFELETGNTFPPEDPWGVLLREKLVVDAEAGYFKNRHLLEVGVGNGRNLGLLSQEVSSAVGIDIVPEFAKLAWHNLQSGYRGKQLEIITARVEVWLDSAAPNSFDAAIACIPVAPGKNSHGDKDDTYVINEWLMPYADKWNQYGLTLLATVLDKLKGAMCLDGQIWAMVPHRVPEQVRTELFSETGWLIEEDYSRIVPQDPLGTPIDYVLKYGGNRTDYFFENDQDGELAPLLTEEAVARCQKVHSGELDVSKLNVYHDLSVIRARLLARDVL